ncbi:MAG: hypothetical protein A3H13_02255 [Candidatus Taylorbacteria bacterium RIFCSPLOWO2_12_FULL_48_11]|nr:MAG: hypothetical protein A3H13_02255 [Candidatus Taylorbacteria bacterium RIFCSPLOWO2_12_FULL_48_11]
MKKIISQTQSEIFERIVRDRSGRAFRVRFVVVERGGTLRGRIISYEQIQNLSPFSKGEYPSGARGRGGSSAGQTTLYLPNVQKLAHNASLCHRARPTASPYFNKFAFLTAIKIRAPSFK